MFGQILSIIFIYLVQSFNRQFYLPNVKSNHMALASVHFRPRAEVTVHFCIAALRQSLFIWTLMSCHLYSSCPHTTKHKTKNITTRQMGSQLAILCTKLCADSINIKDNSSIVWSVTLALKMSIHSSYFQHPCHTAHYPLHVLVGKCLLRIHRMLKLIGQTNLASLLWVSCSFVFLWIWVRLSFFLVF